jgi:hypothetical protein
MGAGFCTVFEADVPPRGKLGDDNKAILNRKEGLDRLAAENGLTPLEAFESYSPEDAAYFLDDDAPLDLPPVQWFPATDGLAAVNALLAHLAAHPDAATDQGELLADLRGIAGELAEAERAGVRFRFAVVP